MSVLHPSQKPVDGALHEIAVALCLAAALTIPALAVAAPTATPVPAVTPAPRQNAVTYDRYSLKIHGKRVYIWSGSFQYWRLPSPSLWRDVLQKMKAAGFNTVTLYFYWGYHSPRPGVYDFSGIRDVNKLLDIAQQVGLYVIARPGPYIEAESNAGGLPGWLTTMKGVSRSTNPRYTAAYMQWLSHIDPIIAQHQITNGTGTVILYQVENELYDASQMEREYMQDIENKARADGITVPLTGNNDGTFASGLGAVQISGDDAYSQGFDCSHPAAWNPMHLAGQPRQPGTPLYFSEFQGGSFDPWGGPGYTACRTLTGPDFEKVFEGANIAAGSTMQNFYMTFGGTTWGWLAYPGVYTSYDYGAAINESRQLTPKYYEQKLLGYFVAAVQPLTHTVRMAVQQPTNPSLRLDARENPVDGMRLYVLRHADVTANGNATTHIRITLPGKGAVATREVLIPQAAGTDIDIRGRDSKMLLANYRFGHQDLVYSTSQLMTDIVAVPHDTLVLYGGKGEDGETVLAYPTQPRVHVLAGKVASHWDAATRRLRLDYVHAGLARVEVTDAGHGLLLLIGTHAALHDLWRVDTAHGPVLVYGPHLVRTATLGPHANATLHLTGDTDKPCDIEVFAPAGVQRVTWNGNAIVTARTPSGSLAGKLPGPAPVALPQLTDWKFKAGAPEIAADFDDANWVRADRTTSNNPFLKAGEVVLDADNYGFHQGDIWYRGHFTATGTEKGIVLKAGTGAHGVFTAWLNGHYLGRGASGRRMDDTQYFNIDRADLAVGKGNVVSVLVVNMGHEENDASNNAYKEPRGLISAHLVGSRDPIGWRVQGNRGGETPIDPVRGIYNNGGLYGERYGWSLPGFPDAAWRTVTLPSRVDVPGVDWYRTTFHLDVPTGQDVPIALKITDVPDRHYRALIFINGWQFGRYVNALGPQHEFVLPPGILNPHGDNTLAIASWSTEHSGGLGKVSLVELGNCRTSLRVRMVPAPVYTKARYAGPS